VSYDAFDAIEVRCPRLGGAVTFGYCRSEHDGLPCDRALLCFELAFPVEAYFRQVLRDETYAARFETPGPGRYESLLDTLAQAGGTTDPAED